ncbi:RNA polymerase sigma-70 factor [Puteibacter caeruleilacunae]|nr:RNA polymerase sigma-70 factor [Puteibacter caeruleilacunae]
MKKREQHIGEDIILQFKKGNEKAFREIYEQYKSRLKGFLFHSLPQGEDLESHLQDIFFKLWDVRQSIDEKQSFESFLFRIARNLVIDILRKRVTRDRFLEGLDINIVSKGIDDTLTLVEYSEFEKHLFELIERLPERRREIFKLSRFQGKTYKEIGKQLGISENTVDTQIRKSLSFLKQGMETYVSVLAMIFLGGL